MSPIHSRFFFLPLDEAMYPVAKPKQVIHIPLWPRTAHPVVPTRLPKIKFRVLIIGRANAGKTTILQRVCDTTESPKVYRITDGRREEVGSRNWVFPTNLII